MLDIKFIRENPDTVKKACELKGMTDYTDQILTLDARVRELKTITQSKTAEKNKITREIPTATDGSMQFCATLNNTGIALPRAIVPVIENHQNPDGSINIPKALQPLMGGRTKIGGKH